VVIGPNPAPAAELAPFCERTNRGGGQGAMVLKITRDSVVKAVKNGLPPAEIVARLERHASNEVPANVLRQVQEWSTWVRRVTSSTMVALRCPDTDSADRVMAAMKRQAERVNSTVVALDLKKLTTTERNKLQEHGILVDGEPESEVTKSKRRK
jgi:Helicase conserved C-terminal domain